MKIDWKNKTFWISLAGVVVIMFQNVGQLFGFEIPSDTIMNVVNAICGVLIVLGILNNPTKTSTDTQTTSTDLTEQTSDNLDHTVTSSITSSDDTNKKSS